MSDTADKWYQDNWGGDGCDMRVITEFSRAEIAEIAQEYADYQTASLLAALQEIAGFDENEKEESWQETFERMKSIAANAIQSKTSQ